MRRRFERLKYSVIGLCLLAGACQQPSRCPEGEPDAGEQATPPDYAQLSRDMEAFREAVELDLERQVKPEWERFFPGTTVALKDTPWTYARSGDAEMVFLLSPSAVARLREGLLREETELGLVSWRKIPRPGAQPTSGQGKAVYVPGGQAGTGALPKRIEIRSNDAPPRVLARALLSCTGCDSPHLDEAIAASQAKPPKIRLTCKLTKPPEVDIEIEFGKGESNNARPALVHIFGELEFSPDLPASSDRALVALDPAGYGAKLTKADAARQAALDHGQKKWVPSNSQVAIEPLQVNPQLVLRRSVRGDLDGDGVIDLQTDWVAWAPARTPDGNRNSITINILDRSGATAYGVLYASEVDRTGPSPSWRLLLSDAPSKGNALPSGLRWVFLNTGYQLPAIATLESGSPSDAIREPIGVTSICIFPNESCESHNVSTAFADGSRLVVMLTIKTKSSPP